MLGDLLYEETGQVTGMEVLPPEDGSVVVKVSLQASGTIQGVTHTSMWTDISTTRADGSTFDHGRGVMTTADGDVVHVVGRASGQSGGPGSPIRARGAFHFQTNSDKLSRLNSLAGVFEYNIDPDGNSKGKIWEWT
ncbi:MAG: hypothetical protein VX262_06525 [Acidobacteriota bacterium]|nr:hypothetical protein [Acidobacteriota bacterium]